MSNLQLKSGLFTPVTDGFIGQARIREEDALDGTVVELTWPAPGVSAVHLSVGNEAATSPELNQVAACFGAPNVTVATTWLTAADARSVDSLRHLVKPKDGIVSFYFTDPITKMHIKRDLGADALRAVAVGIEV